MSSDYSMGRLNNLWFYYFEAGIIFIYAFVTGVFPISVTIGILIYHVLTGLFLFVTPKGIPMRLSRYKRLQIVLLMVNAVILSLTFQSGYIFLYTMFLRVLTTFVYMDEKLCRFQTKLMMVFTIGMYATGFLGLSRKPAMSELVLAFVSLYGASWIITNLARILTFERRNSFEQERSLDDMLKVVEMKCDEARMAARSKTKFLSNMSHEIRTPINTVLGMNEMILRETTDSNIHQYASNVEKAGKMLLSLVNDILDFSKIESGKMEIIPVQYQVSSVLNDIVSMLKPKADEKELLLTMEVNPNIPNLLLGDEVRIRQIATNLLSNAIKYTAEGTVTLIADFRKKAENAIVLYLGVKDTGIGIREEDKSKIFSSFQRIDEKKNRNIEGTGLGLSITSQLVELMNGTIEVESVYGEGSLFSVVIPQTVADFKPIGVIGQYIDRDETHQYQTLFTAPKAHILVVDDNAMNLAVAKGLLKQTLVQVDTALSGEECIRMLRRKKYHILLLDHMMPGMDGIETLRHIKEECIAESMPVIALTANAVSGARQMYLDCGFQDYLSKPIAGDSLEKALYSWLPKDLVIQGMEEEYLEPEEKSESSNLETEVSSKENHIYENVMEDASDLFIFDHNVAMEYCGGDEEIYKQILSMYMNQSEEYIDKMEEYFNSHDWENYRIIVHAIKSTSKTIGAVAFSDLSANMEKVAKNKDKESVSEKHNYFLKQYKLLLERIRKML